MRTLFESQKILYQNRFCKLVQASQWLFFQNVIQLQPHGSKNPIVLYQEMWLQRWLHVSKPLSAATSQRFDWSDPRPGK